MLELLKRPLKNKQGNMLIIVASIVLMVIVITGSAYLYLSSTARIGSTLHYERLKAYYIAEAGVEIAIDRLLNGDVSSISTPIDFAGGTIEDIDVSSEGNDTYVITSIGKFQNAKRILETKTIVGDLIEIAHLENAEDFVYVDGNLKINDINEDSYYYRKNIYVNGKLEITGNVDINIGVLYVRDGIKIRGNAKVEIDRLYIKNDFSINTRGNIHVEIDELYVNGNVDIENRGNGKVMIDKLYLTGDLSTDNRGSGKIIINEVYKNLSVIDLITKSNNNFKINIISWKEVYN